MHPSNQLSPWQAWSFEVQQKLKQHQERLDCLEEQLNAISKQLKQLEAKPSHNIERIEYHFDQLKVEKLDGTLNIGMTVPGNGDDPSANSIEQMTVGKQIQYPSASPAGMKREAPSQEALYQDIYKKLNHFLDSEAQQILVQCENERGVALDPHHRRMIIDDIRRQLPDRIRYYLNQHKNGDNQAAEAYPDLIADQVFAKTKRDADTALHSYMQQLQSTHSSTGGTS